MLWTLFVKNIAQFLATYISYKFLISEKREMYLILNSSVFG